MTTYQHITIFEGQHDGATLEHIVALGAKVIARTTLDAFFRDNRDAYGDAEQGMRAILAEKESYWLGGGAAPVFTLVARWAPGKLEELDDATWAALAQVDDLDAAVLPLQDLLGVTDGGFAGVYFSGYNHEPREGGDPDDYWPTASAERREADLRDYAEQEAEHLLRDAEEEAKATSGDAYLLAGRERDQVLAALRLWQHFQAGRVGLLPLAEIKAMQDIATNGGKHTLMTVEEIDALCQRINVGEG